MDHPMNSHFHIFQEDIGIYKNKNINVFSAGFHYELVTNLLIYCKKKKKNLPIRPDIIDTSSAVSTGDQIFRTFINIGLTMNSFITCNGDEDCDEDTNNKHNYIMANVGYFVKTKSNTAYLISCADKTILTIDKPIRTGVRAIASVLINSINTLSIILARR